MKRFFRAFVMIVGVCAPASVPASAFFPAAPLMFSDIEQEFINHRIRRGDSYMKLSREYYDTDAYWRAIKNYNKIPETALKVGEFIKIPHQPKKYMNTPSGNADDKKDGDKTTEDGDTAAPSKVGTVGDIIDLLKAKFATLPKRGKFPIPISIPILIGLFCYLFGDLLMVWMSSQILRVKNARFAKAFYITLASFTVQTIIVVFVCLAGYLYFDSSGAKSFESIRKIALDSWEFYGPAAGIAVVMFLVVPTIITKLNYEASMPKAGGVVVLPSVLKLVISLFPSMILKLISDSYL